MIYDLYYSFIFGQSSRLLSNVSCALQSVDYNGCEVLWHHNMRRDTRELWMGKSFVVCWGVAWTEVCDCRRSIWSQVERQIPTDTSFFVFVSEHNPPPPPPKIFFFLKKMKSA